MKLYNKSARPHWVGNVLIAPLATEEVGEEWRGAYNANDLEEVKVKPEPAPEQVEEVAEKAPKPGRKPKVSSTEEVEQ